VSVIVEWERHKLSSALRLASPTADRSSELPGSQSRKLLIIRHFPNPGKLVRKSFATGMGIAPIAAVLWHKASDTFKEIT
jgi:hypothetical protein